MRERRRQRRFYLPRSHTGEMFVGTVALLIIIVTGGTLCFEVFEHLSPLDAFYATLNTVTTVGRGMREFSTSGKLISIAIMILGTVTVMLVVALITRAVVEGQIRAIFGRRKMERLLSKLENHFLLCGYGRMGRVIAHELADAGVTFVVIERDETTVRQIDEDGFFGICGDATSDEVLIRCGVQRARVLVAVTPTDADNVFVTLSARQLNPKIFIVARASQDSAIEKLKKAGADRVFSPYRSGGILMAQSALRPNVVDFLAGVPGAGTYQIEELRVEEGSAICGKSLRDLNLSGTLNVIIVGLSRPGSPIVYNPAADTVISNDDILIALAPTGRLAQLAEMAAAR